MSKADRINRKRAVTKEVNYVKQLIAEDEVELIPDRVKRLKDLFKNFSTIHDQYHDSLEDETVIDESEKYFCKAQTLYTEVLSSVKLYIKEGAKTKQEDDDKSSVASIDLSREELMAIMNFPNVELDKGYEQARTILQKRLRNNHLVADHIINHLLGIVDKKHFPR